MARKKANRPHHAEDEAYWQPRCQKLEDAWHQAVEMLALERARNEALGERVQALRAESQRLRKVLPEELRPLLDELSELAAAEAADYQPASIAAGLFDMTLPEISKL